MAITTSISRSKSNISNKQATAVFCLLLPCSANSSTPKMEEVLFLETAVDFYQTTRYNIPVHFCVPLFIILINTSSEGKNLDVPDIIKTEVFDVG